MLSARNSTFFLSSYGDNVRKETQLTKSTSYIALLAAMSCCSSCVSGFSGLFIPSTYLNCRP